MRSRKKVLEQVQAAMQRHLPPHQPESNPAGEEAASGLGLDGFVGLLFGEQEFRLGCSEEVKAAVRSMAALESTPVAEQQAREEAARRIQAGLAVGAGKKEVSIRDEIQRRALGVVHGCLRGSEARKATRKGLIRKACQGQIPQGFKPGADQPRAKGTAATSPAGSVPRVRSRPFTPRIDDVADDVADDAAATVRAAVEGHTVRLKTHQAHEMVDQLEAAAAATVAAAIRGLSARQDTTRAFEMAEMFGATQAGYTCPAGISTRALPPREFEPTEAVRSPARGDGAGASSWKRRGATTRRVQACAPPACDVAHNRKPDLPRQTCVPVSSYTGGHRPRHRPRRRPSHRPRYGRAGLQANCFPTPDRYTGGRRPRRGPRPRRSPGEPSATNRSRVRGTDTSGGLWAIGTATRPRACRRSGCLPSGWTDRAHRPPWQTGRRSGERSECRVTSSRAHGTAAENSSLHPAKKCGAYRRRTNPGPYCACVCRSSLCVRDSCGVIRCQMLGVL